MVIYKSLIRPHFDYCDVIFYIPPSVDGTLNKIESVQYQAALAITGTWRGTSRTKLYNELGLKSLSDRRCINRVVQVLKIVKNQTPEYLKMKLLPPRFQSLINANPYLFQEIRTKSDRYQNTFFPNAIHLWNNIIRELPGDSTVNRTKRHMLGRYRPQPKRIYGIHDPIGLHYLFQLRTGLSPLKSHKCHHNFLDTPYDTCNCREAAEDTNHFLFDCLLFATHQAKLAVNVYNIPLRNNLRQLANNVEFYLYGHPDIPHIDKKQILSSTIQYINDRNRFSREH